MGTLSGQDEHQDGLSHPASAAGPAHSQAPAGRRRHRALSPTQPSRARGPPKGDGPKERGTGRRQRCYGVSSHHSAEILLKEKSSRAYRGYFNLRQKVAINEHTMTDIDTTEEGKNSHLPLRSSKEKPKPNPPFRQSRLLPCTRAESNAFTR